MVGKGPKYTFGRVNGIPLRLDATFVLVPLALVTAMPSYLHESLWLAAAAGTLGIFVSILLHEIGHATMARLHQVGVVEVVVGGFFGYANLKRTAVPRKFLIRILLAGPFTNLIFFLVLWGVLGVLVPGGLDFRQVMYQSDTSLTWQLEAVRAVAVVNLAMFVFNMVPAFPLDGGKILGLLLDRRLSPRASRQVVSGFGIAAGLLMVLFGLGISLFMSIIGGLIVAANLRRLRHSASLRRSS